MQARAAAPRTGQPISGNTGFTDESRTINPLIDLAISQTNTQGAYVYRFNREGANTEIVASRGDVPSDGEVSAKIAAWHWERSTPVVLHQGASSDWRFFELPEFRSGRFEGVVSVPLHESASIVGMANFCRKRSEPWDPRHVSFLLRLSLPLGALVTAATLRAELHKTTRLLADRKLLERAKGLLQASLGCTEENAYLLIRRASRKRRIPMREIAQEIIQEDVVSLAEAWKPNSD